MPKRGKRVDLQARSQGHRMVDSTHKRLQSGGLGNRQKNKGATSTHYKTKDQSRIGLPNLAPGGRIKDQSRIKKGKR